MQQSNCRPILLEGLDSIMVRQHSRLAQHPARRWCWRLLRARSVEQRQRNPALQSKPGPVKTEPEARGDMRGATFGESRRTMEGRTQTMLRRGQTPLLKRKEGVAHRWMGFHLESRGTWITGGHLDLVDVASQLLALSSNISMQIIRRHDENRRPQWSSNKVLRKQVAFSLLFYYSNVFQHALQNDLSCLGPVLAAACPRELSSTATSSKLQYCGNTASIVPRGKGSF